MLSTQLRLACCFIATGFYRQVSAEENRTLAIDGPPYCSPTFPQFCCQPTTPADRFTLEVTMPAVQGGCLVMEGAHVMSVLRDPNKPLGQWLTGDGTMCCHGTCSEAKLSIPIKRISGGSTTTYISYQKSSGPTKLAKTTVLTGIACTGGSNPVCQTCPDLYTKRVVSWKAADDKDNCKVPAGVAFDGLRTVIRPRCKVVKVNVICKTCA